MFNPSKLIMMNQNRGLLEEILRTAKNNRIFMSWLIFDFSTLANKGFVLLYIEETIRLRSVWMFLVACYYGSIALMRIHWQKTIKKVQAEVDEKIQEELLITGVRETGMLLLGLNMVFGGFVMAVVHGDGSFVYGRGVFYIMIIYIVFGFWASVTNAIRDRKMGILWNALRMINLSAAITGLFILVAGLYDNYIINIGARNILLYFTGSLAFLILMIITIHTLLLSGDNE